LDVRDLDNDGNPDFNDTDDDNDGISDTNDFLSGNLSSINTTLTIINITVNGTTNLSKLYNGTFFINITNGTHPIVEFNFTFNENNTLDLGSITLNRSINGTGAVSIRGIDLTGINKTKTVFLEKINTTVDAVCIKDADTGFDTISSACDGSNELLINCNNVSSNSYTCFDTGTRYKITGLNHSAVKELCVDNDGDGYGTGCSAGTDSCDNNPNEHTSSGCDPPNINNNGGSSSSSGGGGGGGGGGTVTATSAGIEKTHFYTSIPKGKETKINVNRKNIAFTRTEFTANKELKRVTLTIRSLDENKTSNIMLGNVYQYVEIETDGITDNDIGNVKIEFDVNSSWIINNNLDADTVILNRYNDGWKELSTKKINESSNKTSYEAISPGFSLFAITTLKPKEIEKKIIETKVKETAKIKDNATVLEPTAVEEVKEKEKEKTRSFFLGLLMMILIIVVGVLVYTLIFDGSKIKKNHGKLIKNIKFKGSEHKHRK
ncbi:MAG: PGF-pre-PGF domain-containing protein, partial [Candidatus Woesearchaeota archaeon]|nr:PGF-pre-PGF domain-containing protein [Candidatus Woesearchaeota archaeon]